MKKKLSKVLAVVLSLVLAVGLAAVDGASVAQAAKKAKKLTLVDAGDLNVTSGETRTIKIKGNKAKKAKWSVKGDGASYVSLNKTKGKKVKMTVADNATGTVKVVAKLTKKNKVTVTYTLSCEATAITLADAEGYTNEAIALETTVTPSNATAVDVTYAVYTDEAATAAAEKATVADGALTATEAGTYYVVATAGTLTSNIAKVVVTDKLAQVTGVKQTRKNVIEVTFDADASKVTDDTLLIENVLGVRVNIEKITLDDAKTTATVKTLVNMADGKDYTVTYGESSATFTATTGEVASITVTPDEAPINTKITVWAQAVDVNGVILDEVKFGANNASYEFTVDIADGGQTDEQNGQIIMDTVGAKAIVDVVYHSNEFDANGEEITFSTKEEIVAVAEGIISGYDKVGFATADPGEKAFTAFADWELKSNVRVDGGKAGSFWITTLVKDDLGNVRVDGSLTAAGYTLESADDTYLLVDGDKVTGVREGKTYVLVKKENEVIFTIPVEIQAASKLTSIELSKATVYLTAGNVALPSERHNDTWKADSASVLVSAKDQYGEDYGKVAVVCEPSSATNNEKVMNVTANGQSIDVVAANEIPTATLGYGKYQSNTYTVKVTDTVNGTEFTKKLFARVTQPLEKAASMGLTVDSAKVDTKLLKADNSNEANQYSTIMLALYDSAGTLKYYEYLPSGASIEVKKGGSTISNVVTSAYTAATITGAGFVTVVDNCSGAAFNDSYQFVTRALYDEDAYVMSASGTKTLKVATKVATGSYKIYVKGIKFNKTTGAVDYTDNKNDYQVTTITVTDTQQAIKVGQDFKTTTLSIPATNDANAWEAIAITTLRTEATDACSAVFSATTANAGDWFAMDKYGMKVISAKVDANKSIAITKVRVYVPYLDGSWGDGAVLPVDVNVNYTIKAE